MLRSVDSSVFTREVSPEVLSSGGQQSIPQTRAWAHEVYTGKVVVGSEVSREKLVEVQRLRQKLGVTEDLRTDLPYLLGFYDESRRSPVTIFLRKNQALCAAVVLYELRHLGLRSGIYLVGDIVGDGAIIGDPAEAPSYIQAAVDVLFKHCPMAHSVRACVSSSSAQWPWSDRRGVTARIQRRCTRRRLKLAKTFPEMLASFGRTTRRNFKQKRVTLESHGRTRFIPSLAPLEAFSAMVGLGDSSHPGRSLRQHCRRYDLLQKHEHTFSMALQDIGGEWLSLLSGWRAEGRTYVDLQMNNFLFPRDSISAVTRSYMLEHEIARGQTDVVFVGGSSMLLQRYCEEDESCFDLLFRRRRILSSMVEKATRLFAPETLVDYIYQSHTEIAKLEDEAAT